MKRASLNHTYRLVWSSLTNTFVAVAENTKANGKKSRAGRSLTATVSALFMTGTVLAADLPTGGQIVGGAGTISQSANVMTINQTTAKMAADWQSFSIGAGNTVNFVQPSASSVAMNRVLGSDVSVIQGALNANGQVFLLNPNGVLFTPTAQVNVGGIVASTLNMTTADFMAGNYQFEGASSNAIINQGNIIAANGGTIALIAAKITNDGSLTANVGNVLLGAGSKVTLDLGGPVKIQVEQGAIDALIEQGGAIKADGGLVYLTAKSASLLATTGINHTGITEAQTLATGESGQIYLMGDMQNGQVNVGGTLDASAPNGGDGGFIETSAAKVSFADGVAITTAAANGKTGLWLIDPVDFKVAATGGDITGSALGTLLGSNSVTIQTVTGTDSATEQFGANGSNGDIFVNDAVSWSANNTLTLNAYRNIAINQSITASGATGKLVLQYGQGAAALNNTATYTINAPINLQAGQNFSTKLGSNGTALDYTVLTSLGAAGSTSGTDLQGINGNLTGRYALGADIDASATAGWSSGAGFKPLGDHNAFFNGELQGLGHVISDLTIIGPQPGNDWVGGMFGYIGGSGLINQLVLDNVSVSGYRNIGAIAGTNIGTISASSAIGSVTGASGNSAGGLVGYNAGAGMLIGSRFSGTVTGVGNASTGGLVGDNTATIENSYTTATVSNGWSWAGGLVGYNYGTINRSYSSSTVSSGSTYVGALVGGNNAYANINNSYWNSDLAGALPGWNFNNGGLNIVQGLTTANMRKAASFVGFNFTTTPGSNDWVIVNGDGSLNSAGTEGDGTRPMLASEYRTVISTPEQLQLMALDRGASYTLAANIDVTATGNNSSVWGSAGFVPVGSAATKFSGAFDGQNHTITALTINRPTTDYVGLFGVSESATINNVALTNVAITGQDWVGALVGHATLGTASNNSVTGQVTGRDQVGGMVGYLNTMSFNSNHASSTVAGANTIGGLIGSTYGGSNAANNYATGNVTATGSSVGGLIGENGYSGFGIHDSYANGSVSGSSVVGGLVGKNLGTIDNSYATGTLSGNFEAGGLVGLNTGTVTGSNAAVVINGYVNAGGLVGVNDGTINTSHATGNVSGNAYMGGLVGSNSGTGSISSSYAAGSVTGNHDLGGLAGSSSGTISNSYATGAINSAHLTTANAGGLVGSNQGSIQNTYSTGSVTGVGANVGGLIGQNNAGTITNSFWDAITSGKTAGIGGGNLSNEVFALDATRSPYNLGEYVAGRHTYGTFNGIDTWIGFDFANTWYMVDGYTRPFLRMEHSTTITNAHQLQLMAMNLTANYTLAVNIDATATNGTSTPSGMWGSKGFAPIGDDANQFTGTFDGMGHTISNLTITRPSNAYIGLFGYVNAGSSIQNVGLVSGSISGWGLVGALVGANAGTVSNSYATSNVIGGAGYNVGGLVGDNIGLVTNSYATGTVSGLTVVGGLVGANAGTVSNSYSTGSVNGSSYIGGLVGNGGTVSNSFWDTTTSGQTSSSGGTGKTTVQMQDITTFGSSGGNWDIQQDSNLTSMTPQLVWTYDGVGGYTSTWVIGASTITTLSYTLGTVGVGTPLIYKGSDYLLGDSWTSSSIFGNSYSGLTLGTDYRFEYNGSPVTGFRNAGTYSDISVAFLNAHFAVAGTGNTAGSFTITPKTVSLSASKTYNGSTALTGSQVTIDTGITGESLTYSGATASDANVTTANKYISTITLANGTGGLASNYQLPTLNNTYAPLTISQRPITVTADAKSKVYGDADPALTYAVTTGNLVGSDSLTGALTRATGENVDTYTIDASALSNGNYLITKQNGTLTISQRPITVTADAKSKVYGDPDPTLTYAITTGSLVGSDSLTGALTRAAGENVNSYTIDATALTNGNYLITKQNGTLTIDQRPITVTADAQNKTVGQTDPVLTWQLTNGSTLLGNDLLVGSLARATGENAGTYPIGQGTLANDNYLVSVIDGILTVTPPDNPAVNVAQSVALIPIIAQPSATPPPQQQTTNTGGITFVDVPGESGGSAGSTGGSENSSGTGDSSEGNPPNDSAGRNSAGFMKIFVVAGGINNGRQISSTGSQNDNAAQNNGRNSN
ncbi:MAG: MBG domain-containing protein [Gallionella sp.]|nr:MBG domain-containing protein [Gallionella sp.]